MADQITKELLQRYLSQDCSPFEKSRIEEYLKSDKSRAIFEEALDAHWALIDKEDLSTGEINYYSTFKKKYKLKSNPGQKIIGFVHFIKYAAVLILGLTIVHYCLRSYSNKNNQLPSISYLKKFNPAGQRSVVTLPDSSVVYLGPESRLEYPSSFTGRKREVNLQGEGFFDVKHKPSRPFIVRSNGIQTIVLGTSFKIETFSPHSVSVSVVTGKVSVGEVTTLKAYRALATLTPGKKVIYDTDSHQTILDEIPVNDLLIWKDGGMVFRDLPLWEICQRLERWYAMKIVVEKPMRDFRMSASFGNVNVNNVIEVISQTAGLKYTIINRVIYLKKKPI